MARSRVVGEEPVIAGTHGESGSDEERFVPGARDLKENFLLTLEDDLTIVGGDRVRSDPR